MSRILPLSTDAVAQIHSSKNITSLQGVILSLLENSLDAGSTKVEIIADFRRWGCTVEDNGSGIPHREFLEDGGLLQMYHTSKQAEPARCALHGSTGTSLASLSALSFLKITSRHSSHEQPATLTAHQNKVVSRQIPASERDELSLSSPSGTLVVVRNLFGNMPVRIKQRDLASDKSDPDAKAWLELKTGVVALLLAWPTPCRVRLRDADIETKMLKLSSSRPNVNNGLTKRGLEQLVGKSAKFDLHEVLPILSQAGLSPVESRANWVSVSGATPRVSAKGVFCLDPSPTKQCQFISLGIHPCSETAQRSGLYDIVNKLFTNSSFGALDDNEDVDETERDRRLHDRRYKNDGYTQKQTHGRKGVDRWPMFVLQVNLLDRSSRLEVERMNESTLKVIVDVMEAMISQWLSSNHFRPRKIRQRKDKDDKITAVAQPLPPDSGSRNIRTPVSKRSDVSQAATTSKKRKYVDMAGNIRMVESHTAIDPLRSTNYFSSWSRIKSGRPSFCGEDFRREKPATAPTERSGSVREKTSLASQPSLTLPTLDVGALNATKPMRTQARAIPLRYASPSKSDPAFRSEAHESSDDYGSFDDQEILATCANADQAPIAWAQTEVDANSSEAPCASESNAPGDALIEWLDPKSKQVFQVNARTGVVLPTRPKTTVPSAASKIEAESPFRQAVGVDTSISSKGQPISLSKRPPSTHGIAEWLPGFLQEWNNPVFVQQNEERIPATFFSLDVADAMEEAQRKRSHESCALHFGQGAPVRTGSLTKTSLADVRVIKQVDQKYILCKASYRTESQTDEHLVLVDQHAASERVILEGLLAELCAPAASNSEPSRSKIRTITIEKPLRFQIPEVEHRLFRDHSHYFADWGIIYRLDDKEERLGTSLVRAAKREYTIIIEYLPPGISERCIMVPRLIIDLLRSEVWSIEESAKKHRNKSAAAVEDAIAEEQHSWLRRIGSCPRGLIDMLNSRACRSAIMFNDELSIVQCQELLSELSKCAFPFMCAHGRVSMVPLVETGASLVDEDISASTTNGGGQAQSFTKAFSMWKTKDADDRHRIEDDL